MLCMRRDTVTCFCDNSRLIQINCVMKKNVEFCPRNYCTSLYMHSLTSLAHLKSASCNKTYRVISSNCYCLCVCPDLTAFVYTYVVCASTEGERRGDEGHYVP